MKKQVSRAFGKTIYLLGKDQDGHKVWLEKGSWDCGWYWGFGYLETYTNNSDPSKARDIRSHQHWNGMVMNNRLNAFDSFKTVFKSSVLTDDELWVLCDLMKTFYTAKAYAELLHLGHSNYTAQANTEAIVKNDDELTRINTVVIPDIMDRVYAILSPAE